MPLDPGYEVPLREETQDEGKLVMRLHHPFNSLAEGRLPGTPKRVAMRNHPPEYTCSTYTTQPSTPFIYSFSFLLCVCVHTTEYSVHVEVGEGFVGVSSLLPTCGFLGSDSGCQAWQRVPIPAESLHGPLALFLSMQSIFSHAVCSAE